MACIITCRHSLPDVAVYKEDGSPPNPSFSLSLPPLFFSLFPCVPSRPLSFCPPFLCLYPFSRFLKLPSSTINFISGLLHSVISHGDTLAWAYRGLPNYHHHRFVFQDRRSHSCLLPGCDPFSTTELQRRLPGTPALRICKVRLELALTISSRSGTRRGSWKEGAGASFSVFALLLLF